VTLILKTNFYFLTSWSEQIETTFFYLRFYFSEINTNDIAIFTKLKCFWCKKSKIGIWFVLGKKMTNYTYDWNFNPTAQIMVILLLLFGQNPWKIWRASDPIFGGADSVPYEFLSWSVWKGSFSSFHQISVTILGPTRYVFCVVVL